MTKLKPCPFCGGKAKLYTDRPIGVSPCMIKPHIECTECTASMYASSAVQVVEKWNRRTEPKVERNLDVNGFSDYEEFE